MKKTILTFGLISGAISAVLMLATMPFIHRIGFDKGMYVGYTGMVLAFMMVFFGIRSYRENVGGGEITFGRAFTIGILITLISSVCYVITWEIIYFGLNPDFCEKYTNYMVEKARNSGASAQMIEATRQQMRDLKALMDNPFLNAAMSFLEPLPVGLLITVISALILRKRKGANENTLPEPGPTQVQA
jgi:hypothetical protein